MPQFYDVDTTGTILMAVIILLIGKAIKKRLPFFENFFIPTPIIGGIILSLLLSLLSYFNVLNLKFDQQIQQLLMISFFATVGFSASFKFLKTGGKTVALFLLCTTGLVILQDALGIFLAFIMNKNLTLGLVTGSIPMTGGHGTAAAFGPLLEGQFNLQGASTIAIAAATFGLICGSLLGGPIGKYIMSKYELKPDLNVLKEAHVAVDLNSEKTLGITEKGMFDAVKVIAFAVGIGHILFYYSNHINLIMPTYIGAMFAAVIIRNLSDYTKLFAIKDNEVTAIGNICLQLFLAMALMQMNLTTLIELAIPIFVILFCQVLMMGLYAYYVTFRVMGKNYDAAVMAVGHCGFGLGATPNAIANMEAFTEKYYPSPQAFFVLPIVGSLFIDFINSGVITASLNLLS